MATIKFNDQFAPLVTSGQKRQTIRKPKSPPIKAGDTLDLCNSYNKKADKEILLQVICKSVVPITIENQHTINLNGFRMRTSRYGSQFEDLAKDDGFENWAEMFRWFNDRYKLPMKFDLIKWDYVSET